MLKPPSVKSVESNLEVCEIGNTAQLTKQIKNCVSDKFNGQLNLQAKSAFNQQWSLFFQSGSLIGCSSSVHPMRRWCRQQFTHCPQLDL
ncbi:MAG: response regulator, partial [Symploca sp. SIO3E6]|nr:response regulator [Caldora sp. SIO3E6]